MQSIYQFFFIFLISLFCFWDCTLWAMEEAKKSNPQYLLQQIAKGNEEKLLALLTTRDAGYESIKDQDKKPALSIDWHSKSVYFLQDNGKDGTIVHTFSFAEAKRLLQNQEIENTEIGHLLDASTKQIDTSQDEEPEKAYAETVTLLQRSLRKYYHGEETIYDRGRCCWGCCLY